MKKNDIFFHSLLFVTLKYKFFFGHFRLPEVIETPIKPQFQPFPTTCKRVWVASLNRLAVRGRPDLDPRKKSRLRKFSAAVLLINFGKNDYFLNCLVGKTSKIYVNLYFSSVLQGKRRKSLQSSI